VEVVAVATLSQGRTAAAQCGLFTHKSVPVIFEPPYRTHCWAGIENYTFIKHSQYLPLELQQCFQQDNHFSDDFLVCKKVTILQ
jgi:hypothetical protein